MGTVNYGTSDYITLAIEPYDVDDIMDDPDWRDYIATEWKVDLEDEDAVTKAAYEEIEASYDADRENFDSAIKEYSGSGFCYFRFSILPGHEKGLYVNIENDLSDAFDDWREKRAAQKELTKIRAFLRYIAGCGFVQCFPGWVTSYNDYKGTLKSIDAAIREMREEVWKTPTWKQYNRIHA